MSKANPEKRRGGRGNPQSALSPRGGAGGPPSGFDGPASPASPRSPGQPTSPPRSPTGQQAPGSHGHSSSSPGSPGTPEFPLTDPARDPKKRPRFTDNMKNVDLPASAYNINNEVSSEQISYSSHLPIIAVMHNGSFQ